jgi:hypothetical protein
LAINWPGWVATLCSRAVVLESVLMMYSGIVSFWSQLRPNARAEPFVCGRYSQGTAADE